MRYVTAEDVFKAYYNPVQRHPWPLRITATHILPARAHQFPQVARSLKAWAKSLLYYAAHLESTLDPDWITALRANNQDKVAPLRRPKQDLVAAGFGIGVIDEYPIKVGLQKRTYRLIEVERGQGAELMPSRVVASLTAVQHIYSCWELVEVEVLKHRRRCGIATLLYSVAEEIQGAPFLSPSGWISQGALAFWAKRRPGIEEHYVEFQDCPGLFMSKRQSRDLRAAASLRIMDALEPHERRRLH